jgi:hypothetical protein
MTAALCWTLQAVCDYRISPFGHMTFAGFAIINTQLWMFLASGVAIEADQAPGIAEWRLASAILAGLIGCGFCGSFGVGTAQAMQADLRHDGGFDHDGIEVETFLPATPTVVGVNHSAKASRGTQTLSVPPGVSAMNGHVTMVNQDGEERIVDPDADSCGLQIAALHEYLAITLVAIYFLSFYTELEELEIRLDLA